MTEMRSSMNRAVFCATSFLSLLAFLLYISISLFIKSSPRFLFVFFTDTVTTEVLLLVGSMDKAPRYPLATDRGLTMLTSILPLPVGGTEGLDIKVSVPASPERTAGNFVKCLLTVFSPMVAVTSICWLE